MLGALDASRLVAEAMVKYDCRTAINLLRDTNPNPPFAGSPVIPQNTAIQAINLRSAKFDLGFVRVVLLLSICVIIPGRIAAAQSPAKLQSLLNDSVAQLQLAYRNNIPEQQRRYDELAQVVGAWREAPRNDANNRLLEEWLRGAIRSSMPGSQQPLPPVPQFERPIVQDLVVPADLPPATIAEPVAPPHLESETEPRPANDVESIDDSLEKSLGNPFSDDPEPTE